MFGRQNKKSQSVQPRRRLRPGGDETGDSHSSGDHNSFRRNRTLTGSLSSGVSSVGEPTANLRSSRMHAHDLRRHRRRLLLVLGIVLGISAGLYVLTNQFIASVVIKSTAPVLIDQATYEQKVQDYFGSHPLERFQFSLNTSSLTSYLQTHGAPEVQNVQTGSSSHKLWTINLTASMRQPVVRWSTGNGQLYVDASGQTFNRDYYTDKLVEVRDESGITIEQDRVLVSARMLSLIGSLVGQMKTYGYEVTTVILPPNTSRQVLVSLRNLSYNIKFSTDRLAGEQAEDASMAIGYFKAHGIVPQYVDVRVSGRAYYQ